MKRVIAGNWKMNHGPAEARSFFERLEVAVDPEDVLVIIFPPAVSLPEARSAIPPGIPVALGVQNISPEPSGAFTGETSAELAAAAGATYTLVGHSERRQIFGETDAETVEKVAAAYRGGLVPVLCVGETLEERKAGRLSEIIVRQLDAVAGNGASTSSAIAGGAPFLVAYEPVWAIGTGETATPEDAARAHAVLREHLRARFPEAVANEIPILYGGSVKPANVEGLLAAPGVDGVLVGGASLEADSFGRIVGAAAG